MENDMKEADTKLFAVTGKPILHSLSHQMQNAAFEAAGVDAVYTRLAAESANEALNAAKALGISGLNVTSPFKEEIAKLCDALDDNAKKTGAVNTMLLDNGKVIGFNTDVIGVSEALATSGIVIAGKNALVIGAGGAAKAAIIALVNGGAEVTIANRTFEKAEKTAKKFGCKAIEISELNNVNGVVPHADIIISVITQGGNEKIVPHGSLKSRTAILDANYSVESTIVRDAMAAGCKVIDGREWLLQQGAAAFRLFIGKDAPIEVMRAALYANRIAAKRKSNIALIGFMGSGKTTVAKRIAVMAGMKHIDIDENIEQKSGTKIKEIFENHGEMKFRDMENEEVSAINGTTNTVIACGGGAILDPKNVEILQKNCTVVWLTASPKTIFERIGTDESRPLLNVEDRESVAQRIIKRRIPIYAKIADIIVHTDAKSAEDVAKQIVNEVLRG